MLIDGFTVAAQIVNFFILVALMKFFLYRPILKAMAERQEKVAAHLHAARDEKRKARAEAEAYRKKNEDWETQQLDLQAQARQAADGERKALIDRAHQEVDRLQTQWHEALEHQKAAFLRDLRKRVVRQVYATIRRVLKDLANRDLEHQIASVFVEGLQGVNREKWEAAQAALRDKKGEIVLQSAFEISPETREKIAGLLKKGLSEKTAEKTAIVYETEPEALCGLTLKVPGYKMAWDVNHYLETLEDEIGKTFEAPKSGLSDKKEKVV